MANKTADVTAIVPYYRDNDTIKRAVQSILNQKILPKAIFVIDDFSNRVRDSEILSEIENLSDIIKVFYLPVNKGPGDARNKGLDEANTKYVAFLDSDDTWDSKKIETQLNYMEKYNAFISAHDSSIDHKKVIADKSNDDFSIITPRKQLLKNRLGTRTVMMRNIDKYRFESGKRHVEDFLLWTQIILDGHKAIKINECLAYSYKENYGESGLTSNLGKLYKGALDAFRTLLNEKKIHKSTYFFLVALSTLKHLYRLIKVGLRKRVHQ